ncbi:MAG: DUF4976 domain-containing protein, partial [Verrucomicrobiales bacterium]|nr:DUF4976 domain-containing protein [Verrucomicrobiales bacterium]
HSVARHYGVTTGQHKLIHYYQLDEWELFDLEKDPNELQSVYDEAEYAGKQAELKKELDRLREQYQVDEDTYVAPVRKPGNKQKGKGGKKAKPGKA